jgi:hypothetical protein
LHTQLPLVLAALVQLVRLLVVMEQILRLRLLLRPLEVGEVVGLLMQVMLDLEAVVVAAQVAVQLMVMEQEQ